MTERLDDIETPRLCAGYEECRHTGPLRHALLLESVLSNMSDGVVVIDVDGGFKVINQAAEALIGMRIADSPPERWPQDFGLFLPDTVTPHPYESLPMMRALRGEAVENHLIFVRPPSKPQGLWLSVNARPLPGEDGGIQGAIAVFRDVTALRQTTERLERSADELRRSNRDLESFASVASHDLKEPIRKMEAFGELLASECGNLLEPQALDYIRRIQAAAARMHRLIEDLLSFSRVSNRGGEFTPLDLDRVVREALSDLELRIRQADGRVEVGPLGTIQADESQMRQLVQNLVGNGLKFRRPEEPPVVRVSGQLVSEGRPNREYLRLVVEDNGIGFEEKFLDRIFMIFQRLHPRHVYEGTGIGLAICRRIAERHGGNITARSMPGRGSSFIVTLPVLQLEEE